MRRQLRWHAHPGIPLLVALLVAMTPGLVRAEGTPEAVGTPGATPAASPVAPGPPRYPDLAAQPPNDLYFSTELLDDGQEHLLLRFSTTTVNAGEGPLELTGDADDATGEMVTQLVYDGRAGGNVVETRQLGIDLILHPQHHHFHLARFAAYELLRMDGERAVPTGQGGKQSSCVLDSRRIDESGPDRKAYDACELDRQGLSVGWGDTYSASLPDQWIDLGDGPLADGDYVLRYTVDPLGQIAEHGRTANNVAETRFTVRGGAIVGRPEPPRCAIDGDDHGSPGAAIRLTCSHFPEPAPVMIYWGAWDPWAIDLRPIARAVGQGPDPVRTSFAIPDVEPGGYLVSIVAWDSERGGYVSATVIVEVEPAPPATPGASPAAATPDPGTG